VEGGGGSRGVCIKEVDVFVSQREDLGIGGTQKNGSGGRKEPERGVVLGTGEKGVPTTGGGTKTKNQVKRRPKNGEHWEKLLGGHNQVKGGKSMIYGKPKRLPEGMEKLKTE